MKYSSLKGEKQKLLELALYNKGVNLSDTADKIQNGQFTECKNIWAQGNRTVTRAGFKSDYDCILKTQIEGSAGRHNLKLTDTYFFYMGENRRIVTERFYYDLSSVFICVYLMGTDCNLIPIGHFQFGRVDDTTFFTPENILFYVGAPQNGGGIFAFVSLVNEHDYETREYRIYEINREFNEWHINTDYYIPTVYINGRGNLHEKALGAINNNLISKPKELETPNLLTGSFYSYFTSDGYSYSFKLPLANLANSPVVCSINDSPFTKTEWVIDADADSAINTFFGSQVTAHIDREKGILHFTVASGNYSVPRIDDCSENNIQILATKAIYDNWSQVVSSTCSATIGSRIIFSGSTQGNRLYYACYDNPLYFPADSDIDIASADSPITALFAVEDKILAFKESSIYSITLKEGAPFNKTALLSHNSNIFYKNDEFSIRCLNKKIGCKNRFSICSYSGYPIWYGNDDNIYSISSSANIYKLSGEITPYFKKQNKFDLQDMASLCTDTHYFLSMANQIIVMEFCESSLKDGVNFYFWDIPSEYKCLGGIAKANNVCFMFENTRDNCFFTASLSDGDDIMISKNTPTSYPIKSNLATKVYRLGNLKIKNIINSIYLELASKGNVNIRIQNEKGDFSDFLFDQKRLSKNDDGIIKIIPEINPAKTIQLTLDAEDTFSLGNIEIYYRNLLK